MDDAIVRARARRAYELGRLRHGLTLALVVPPLALLSLFGCGAPELTLACGGALLVLVVGLGWRGQGYGRAVLPGVIGGVAPFAAPLLLRWTGSTCTGGLCLSLVVACLAGGVVAGAFAGACVRRMAGGSAGVLVASLAVAGLTGALGCVLAGAGGMLGLGVGMLAGAAPAYLMLRPAA